MANENTVILVGAGATLAEALPSQPARKDRPPLDTTFFEYCRLAELPGRHAVSRYMNSHYGIDPFDGLHRMEEIFNHIYSDAFSLSPPGGCLKAYWSLLRMYSDSIARTTNPINGKSRYGVGALLRYLWRSGKCIKPTFITFNQDIVIEKAIEETKSMSSYNAMFWDIRNAYGIDFGSWIIMNAGSQPFHSPCLDTIRVLKLHGSLNWVYRVRSGTDPKNCVRSPSGPLMCLNDQKIFLNLRHRVKSRWTDVVPLVVPPIYEKASRYKDIVGRIWDEAITELKSAKHLIIFGYSFPDADFAARSLFRRCFHSNSKIDSVTVIDTNPAVAGHIANILAVKSLKYFRDVPTFIRHA